MGYKHNCCGCLGTDAQQLALHVFACHFVESAKWFVHQQQRWMCCKCTSNCNALLHATRQLPWIQLGKLWQLHELQHFLGTCCALLFVPTLELKWQLDVLCNSAPVKQTCLLKRHAVVLIETRLRSRLAIDCDRTRSWFEQVCDQSQQRALATT